MSLQSGEIGRLNCGRCPNASCTVASSACRPRNGAVPCSSSKAIMANANWSTFAVYGSCAAKQGKNPEPGEGFREGGSDRRRRRRGLRSSGFHGAGSIPRLAEHFWRGVEPRPAGCARHLGRGAARL